MRKETKAQARARLKKGIAALESAMWDRSQSDERYHLSGAHGADQAQLEGMRRKLAALAPVPRKPRTTLEQDVATAERSFLPLPPAVGIPLPPPPARSGDRSRLEAMLRDLAEEMDRVRLCMRMVTDRQGPEISECLAAVSLAHNTLRDLKRAALGVQHA